MLELFFIFLAITGILFCFYIVFNIAYSKGLSDGVSLMNYDFKDPVFNPEVEEKQVIYTEKGNVVEVQFKNKGEIYE